MYFISDKPHNPIVNSGGIMSIALILKEVQQELGLHIAAKYDYVFNFIQNSLNTLCSLIIHEYLMAP